MSPPQKRDRPEPAGEETPAAPTDLPGTVEWPRYGRGGTHPDDGVVAFAIAPLALAPD
jgi:hypothetical protein